MLEIRLFGAFRSFSEENPVIQVSVERSLKVRELKQLLFEKYLRTDLIFDSCLASDTQILNDEFLLHGQEKLAILPPVSGG